MCIRDRCPSLRRLLSRGQRRAEVQPWFEQRLEARSGGRAVLRGWRCSASGWSHSGLVRRDGPW
eukprot:5479102-Pyramimonas_sp.AAC.1